MEHDSDIITVDIYGDNDKIIADFVDEFEIFIKRIYPEKQKSKYDIKMNQTYLLMKPYFKS